MFKIMAIDDSPLIRKIVGRALEGKYELASFEGGRDAVAAARNEKPDLVLLDVEMPDMDGFDTIKKLNEIEGMKNVPILFLTGKNDVEFELKALELGAVDYLNKPFSNELLTKRIEIHIKQATDRRKLAEENVVKERAIHDLQAAIVFALADLVEMRDNSTGGHVLRTLRYYEIIFDYLIENRIYLDQLEGIDKRLFIEASQLHDVGKVAIPDAILLKPGQLTKEEFEIMKTHTTIGYNAIKRAMDLTNDKAFLNFAAQVALTHHERWDGTGYPGGIAGKDIPISGRIMAIVDVYDALVSERHYKKSMPHAEAMDIITSWKGTHFDPALVDVCVALNKKFEEISKVVA